jgi:hypothetical protein
MDSPAGLKNDLERSKAQGVNPSALPTRLHLAVRGWSGARQGAGSIIEGGLYSWGQFNRLNQPLESCVDRA